MSLVAWARLEPMSGCQPLPGAISFSRWSARKPKSAGNASTPRRLTAATWLSVRIARQSQAALDVRAQVANVPGTEDPAT